MRWLAAFWRQPCRRYRDFQLVFTVLTLNFVIPAFVYTFDPQAAMDQFLALNALLGGADYTFPEASSRVWRYLAAANVMTLGLCCLLLQLELRRLFAVIVPLTFMKLYAATCWLVGWMLAPEYLFFLGAAVLDFVTSGAFLWFGLRARREIEPRTAEELVPPPLVDALGRPGARERRWRAAVFSALIPVDREGGLPGLGEVDLERFWATFERRAPALARLGLRASVWLITLAPLVWLGSPRLFQSLTPARRDELLARLASSRLYLVRQLLATAKTLACLAYLGDPEIRQAVEQRSEA